MEFLPMGGTEKNINKEIYMYICPRTYVRSCSRSAFLYYIALQSEPREDRNVGSRKRPSRKFLRIRTSQQARKPTCMLRRPSDSFIRAIWCIIFTAGFTTPIRIRDIRRGRKFLRWVLFLYISSVSPALYRRRRIIYSRHICLIKIIINFSRDDIRGKTRGIPC